ncbi:MAG TPA: WavE lipopolysaccharide synthesis family protein [Noviherbaspirillum sp.]|uniref:WavE lipopolysaccharide synthesis family protein n=1 Tax=Noviherbaspirillum sp. TaxID=1926288 RepID=UPI002D573C9C|nr:WavE lipopolysaccharide synthesis family protein [Noviherbaspirillum sp.]HYD96003.1 WavE lipopolysaccharide synthesis family protein [Noviherbaspirillum sp.]
MRNSDITVVFQGAFKPYTTQGKESFLSNVRAVRRVLPGAKIIVSTWEGAEIPRGLGTSDIVFAKDPGGLAPLKLIDNKINNVNRQIVSTSAGMAAVETAFAIKLRTDCYLEHAGFLDFYAEQLKRDKGHRRILVNCFFTLNPVIFERIPYHLSDWFQFGPTELLRAYWSAPLMSPQDARFYEFNPHPPDSTLFEKRFRSKLAAEQHICTHYARSLGYACPQFLNDRSPQVMKDFYRFIAEETIVLDPWQAGLVFPKYTWVNSSLFQKINNLMYLDWLKISGQVSHEDIAPWQAAAVMKRRERLQRIAEYGFRHTTPLHPLIFEPSRQGNVVRRTAYHVLKLFG